MQARVAGALHLVGALSGLIYTTRAGVYWLELADHFVPMLLTLSVGVGQCIIVSRYYGATRLFSQLPEADQKFAAFWVRGADGVPTLDALRHLFCSSLPALPRTFF
eukprot:2264901-Pleurochrysis_carterae.AAC.1